MSQSPYPAFLEYTTLGTSHDSRSHCRLVCRAAITSTVALPGSACEVLKESELHGQRRMLKFDHPRYRTGVDFALGYPDRINRLVLISPGLVDRDPDRPERTIGGDPALPGHGMP